MGKLSEFGMPAALWGCTARNGHFQDVGKCPTSVRKYSKADAKQVAVPIRNLMSTRPGFLTRSNDVAPYSAAFSGDSYSCCARCSTGFSRRVRL
jgi:hypothetical protein